MPHYKQLPSPKARLNAQVQKSRNGERVIWTVRSPPGGNCPAATALASAGRSGLSSGFPKQQDHASQREQRIHPDANPRVALIVRQPPL